MSDIKGLTETPKPRYTYCYRPSSELTMLVAHTHIIKTHAPSSLEEEVVEDDSVMEDGVVIHHVLH